MDNLTHTAAGLFLSRAGLNRWTPQATAILIVAANAPDIDAVSLAGGAASYLHYHRHLTHSLIAMPVLAALSVLAVRAVSRKPVRWPGAFAIALIGVASHLALDYTNGYGIRLLLPFSPRFYRLEWTNIVDFVIWAMFLLALAAPFLARLVGAEIASSSRRPAYPGRGWPIFALVFATLYICARGVLHSRATAELNSWTYQGAQPLRIAAGPSATNPFSWGGIVETDDFYALTAVDLTGSFDPERMRIVHKPPPNLAFDSAQRASAFQIFLRFAEFPQWSLAPAEGLENGKLVSVTDMRFYGWSAFAIEDASGRVLRAWIGLGPLRKP